MTTRKCLLCKKHYLEAFPSLWTHHFEYKYTIQHAWKQKPSSPPLLGTRLSRPGPGHILKSCMRRFHRSLFILFSCPRQWTNQWGCENSSFLSNLDFRHEWVKGNGNVKSCRPTPKALPWKKQTRDPFQHSITGSGACLFCSKRGVKRKACKWNVKANPSLQHSC